MPMTSNCDEAATSSALVLIELCLGQRMSSRMITWILDRRADVTHDRALTASVIDSPKKTTLGFICHKVKQRHRNQISNRMPCGRARERNLLKTAERTTSPHS